jgi:hypothetical protein
MNGAIRSTVVVAAMVVALPGPAIASLSVNESAQSDAHAVALPSSTTHVRPTTRTAASLLEQGAARSATFRHLVETLERSDMIVGVETGYLTRPSQLVFITATPAARYVRIALNRNAVDDELLPWLAHELQHAVEIASSPGITSNATLQAFYREHGLVTWDGNACTRAAQEVAVIVRREIVRGNPKHLQPEPR